MKAIGGFIILAALSTALLSGCKKQDDASTFISAEPTNKDFQPCDCTSGKSSVEEYIKADLGGATVCFDVIPSLPDTFPNMMKWGYIIRDTGMEYYDNLYMIRMRQTANGRPSYSSRTHMP